jgi:hypothetical protein
MVTWARAVKPEKSVLAVSHITFTVAVYTGYLLWMESEGLAFFRGNDSCEVRSDE